MNDHNRGTQTELPTTADIEQILQAIPHRYPFLLVDRVTEIDHEKKTILGKKNVTMNESFFQGHFPGKPIMPGVLILEALAQLSAVYVKLRGEIKGKIAVFLNIKNAKFRKPVRPGDTLILFGELIHLSSKGGKAYATAKVDGQIACEAEFAFAFVPEDQI